MIKIDVQNTFIVDTFQLCVNQTHFLRLSTTGSPTYYITNSEQTSTMLLHIILCLTVPFKKLSNISENCL